MNEQIISIVLSAVLPAPVLAGAKGGQAAFLLLRAAMPVLSPGQLVVVDFGQMQICTASAIRELLVPMWQSLRENGCVGIVGNADEVTLDEIKLVADTSKQLARYNTQVTVWNNRLAALEDIGLLSRRKVSKTKFYFPILKGMTYGH